MGHALTVRGPAPAVGTALRKPATAVDTRG
jgi:hypothetical protein